MKHLIERRSHVLSISSSASDHLVVRRLVGDGGTVLEASSCAEAVQWLGRVRFAAVICDDILPDGGWRDVLSEAARIDTPPPVIVTSRLADERLWAAVLDSGGFDVLAKPLDAAEFQRGIAALNALPVKAAVQHAA